MLQSSSRGGGVCLFRGGFSLLGGEGLPVPGGSAYSGGRGVGLPGPGGFSLLGGVCLVGGEGGLPNPGGGLPGEPPPGQNHRHV